MKFALPKTETPLLFSNKKLIALIIPLFIEQSLLISVGVFDTMMVASLGEAAVSGVSLADSISILLLQMFTALATGGAVVTSQWIGHRSPENAKKSANQLMLVVAVFSLVTTLILCVFNMPILQFVFGSLEDEVMSDAAMYLFITALSYPFIGLYNGAAALFRAQGNSKISMLASLCMNGLNIVGNALFIFGLGMGVFGAALATLLSRVFAAVVVLWLLQKSENPLRIDAISALRPHMPTIRRILSIGIPSGIESGMFQFGRLAVSGLVSTLGTSMIAANAVSSTIVTVLNVPANAMGLTLITVVGQCIGAGEKEQARYYGNRLLAYGYCGAWVMNIGAVFFMPYVLQLYNLSPEAYSTSVNLIRIFNAFSLGFFVPSYVLPNLLRAAGDAKFTMWVCVISMWMFRVLLCYILVIHFSCGLYAVWLCMFGDWVSRTIFYGTRYLRGKWLDKKVI